jgi:hypothetical protein
MPIPGHTISLEDQIDQWRSYLGRRQAAYSVNVAELEDQLRAEVARLVDAGLATDEAFLVSVKRTAGMDALSREFAREHASRLWTQLVLAPSDSDEALAPGRRDAIVAFCLAVAAAVAIKVPVFFGLPWNEDNVQTVGFYARNLSLLLLPILTGYFVWKRNLDMRTLRWLLLAFLAAGVVVNVYRFAPLGSTLVLTALHLPIALWLVVGIAHAGGRWSQVSGRMDFIRFSGELFVYYVLIALGGGVFTAFMAAIFQAIGISVERFVTSWQLPCGAAGAVLVASWLVEAKQRVVENIAPMLTRVFTPLFAAMLIAFLVALLWTGRGVNIERNVLIAFDLLLVVVIGLLLYSVSARDPQSPPDAFDLVQIALVMSALVADAVALWAIATRINDFGFTPNRVAALGVNVVLLINLAWSAVLHVRFLRSRGSFSSLERWQTDYLPVYAAWAAIVVMVFPPLFNYI